MPRPINKDQLLTQSQKEYDAIEKTLADLSPEQMTKAAPGEWSVKDIIAHLYEWQQMFFRWYEAGLRGETPAVPAEGYKWNQLPALNQKIYEQYQNHPLDEILTLWRTSHQQTLELIESLSNKDLTTPGLYPWMNKNTLVAYLAANGSSHYTWARKEMRKSIKASKR